MTNPTPFFSRDFFATRDVTLSRLQKFTRDAIQRLTLDNPGGVFDQLIADLTTYYEALFGSLADADAGISQRRGAAEQMWGALADLQDQLEADEALITYKDQKNPGLRAAFLPNGRDEYGQASLLTADLLFNRAQQAATTHAATLGPDFDAAAYTRFYEAFKAGRDGTGAGDEQSAKARAEAKNQRTTLTERLTDAVKRVANEFLRDEARCRAYFRFELLSAPATATAADAAANPE
ncbi:MAG: hypothetical protein H7330_08180 [Hymenobacteraceae bacterium]|nr:hypothetical protein [Hymenobacteraceae bacterium]